MKSEGFILQLGRLPVQWMIILEILRIVGVMGCWVWRSGAEGAEFVVNAEDGSCQEQELCYDGAIASGNLMGLADGERDEREDYGYYE